MSPGIRSNARPGTSLPGLFLLAAARPHLLLPAWLAALTGAALGPSAGQTIAPSHILAGVACWSLTLLAVNLVNLLTDQASDLANGKNLAWRGVVGPDLLGATAAGASLLGVAGAILLAPQILLPVLAGLGLGLAYCLPPTRLCARPGLDLLAHLAGYALLAPWTGSLLAGAPAAGPAPLAVLYLVPLVGVSFLLTAVLDLPGDRATGKRTSAVWLARKWTALDGWAAGPWRRRSIIVGVAGGVLLAGLPGLVRWPGLLWPLGMWVVLGYLVQGLARTAK
jgi:1,4-dihydroxy-2-naphthoate octaprenyltransferase